MALESKFDNMLNEKIKRSPWKKMGKPTKSPLKTKAKAGGTY
jgi:hypothetical protein